MWLWPFFFWLSPLFLPHYRQHHLAYLILLHLPVLALCGRFAERRLRPHNISGKQVFHLFGAGLLVDLFLMWAVAVASGLWAQNASS